MLNELEVWKFKLMYTIATVKEYDRSQFVNENRLDTIFGTVYFNRNIWWHVSQLWQIKYISTTNLSRANSGPKKS